MKILVDERLMNYELQKQLVKSRESVSMFNSEEILSDAQNLRFLQSAISQKCSVKTIYIF